MKCHICDTTSAPSYYTPRDMQGVTMCCDCVRYAVFMTWNPHRSFSETVAQLQKIISDRKEYKREKTDINIPHIDEVPLSLRLNYPKK